MATKPSSNSFRPARITKPQRVLNSAHALLRMPREIVHQILDNLTVFQVLQLASCLEDPTYLDHCILGHCKYQHLFKSQKEITEVRDLFIVFHDLRASMKLEQAPKNSPLAHNIGTFSSNGLRVAHGYLPKYLCQDMRNHLTIVNKDRLRVLEQYSDPGILGTKAALEAKEPLRDWQAYHDAWNRLVAAGQKINDIKANQLLQIADVFERYPKILKRSTDPSQMPRANTSHIVSHFLDWARLVKGYQWLGPDRKYQASSLFAYPHLPIVPFDSCLRLFCRFIDQNPATKPRSTLHKWIPYPAPILQDIRTVIAGLEITYIKSVSKSFRGHKGVPRTKYTKQGLYIKSQQNKRIPLSDVVDEQIAELHHWKPICQNIAGLFPNVPKGGKPRKSWMLGAVPFAESACPDDCWEVAHYHPVFTLPPCGHFGILFDNKVLKDWAQFKWEWASFYLHREDDVEWLLLPHNEKELEWLQAFCRVVTYMQKVEAEKVASNATEEKMQHLRLNDHERG